MIYYLGFRISEFCALTRFSYDAKNQTLTGGMKTEAGKDRIVPIHSKIKNIVAAWVKMHGEALYCDESGKPYNKDTFKRSGIPSCSN